VPRCTGTIHGAAYTILVPKSWNGTLLLYSHGYRTNSGTKPGRAQVSQSDSTGVGQDETSRVLLAAGYALAGSSYSSNGWAVQDAITAANDLHQRFVELAGSPKRTYVWGSSLGGLITEVLAERSSWVDGAAPMCGVVSGPLLMFDELLKSAMATKALLDPGLRISGWPTADDARRQSRAAVTEVQRAAKDYRRGGAAKVVYIAGLLGLPTRTPSIAGTDLRSVAAAAAQTLERYLTFAIPALYEADQRFGGNPAQTTGDLSPPVDRTVAAHVISLHGFPDAYADAVASMAPIAATESARAALKSSGDPNGDLRVPTITLHTEYDALALTSGETVLRNRVARAVSASHLMQLYIAPPASEEPGTDSYHCAFTPAQMTGLISALDAWVRGDRRPSPAALGRDLGPRLDLHFSPAAWPT
jgi:hypothetical protein